MNLGNSVRSYLRNVEITNMVDHVHMNVTLLHTAMGKYHLIQDCHAVVNEMVRDRVEGILLLERTGRIFLPLLRAIYRKKGLPFPIWKTFDPGPNPYGHPLDTNRDLELIRKDFEKVGKIGVFDEYMVSGIRLKNTVLRLSKELQHPVRGYVLQNQHGSENPDIQLDVFSAGSERSAKYLEIRNSFTDSIFREDEPMRFKSSRVSIPVYRRILHGILEEIEKTDFHTWSKRLLPCPEPFQKHIAQKNDRRPNRQDG